MLLRLATLTLSGNWKVRIFLVNWEGRYTFWKMWDPLLRDWLEN